MTATQGQQGNGKTSAVAWEATRDWVKDQSPGTIAALVLLPAAVVTVTLMASKRARRGAKRAVKRVTKAAQGGTSGRRRGAGRSTGRRTATSSVTQ